jgi:hypothetical protein
MIVFSEDDSHHGPDDGGGTRLWNVSLLLLDYMLLYPRRLSPSYLLLWEPEISQLSYVYVSLCAIK